MLRALLSTFYAFHHEIQCLLRLLGMLAVSTVSVYSFVAYAMVVVMYFSGLFHGHGTARYECNSLK